MSRDIFYEFANKYTKEFICYHDPTGKIISSTESTLRVIGYESNELIGKNIYDFIHEEDKDFFEINVHLPIINGKTDYINADLRFLKKEGEYTWLNLDLEPQKNEKGIITNIFCIARDISEFISMKEKYERKNTLLSTTGQMAQLGAWELDPITNARIWSKETYDIFEVDINEMLTLDQVYNCYSGDAGITVRKSVKNALEHGIPFDLIIPLNTLKGKKIWVRLMGTPKIHLGKVVKLFGVIQNIDKEVNANLILKSMVKQLSKQNRQLEDFTHILSHNVRGPIASLSILINMLENAESVDEKAEIMDMMKLSSKSLDDLLNELKEVINATHVHGIESQENEIMPIVNYATELLKGEIIHTKAVVNVDLRGWKTINYPKIYLESILMNLLSNALKYRSEERTPIINISTILENGVYILKFSDNGCGIDMSKHGNNVFKLYKTFHVSKPGKGLGLFMTKSQIEAMGGEITIESELNVGTTFTIIFNKEKVTDLSETYILQELS